MGLKMQTSQRVLTSAPRRCAALVCNSRQAAFGTVSVPIACPAVPLRTMSASAGTRMSRSTRSSLIVSAAAAPSAPTEATGKLISSTEVPAFIQRDDMIDQLYHWAVIEAGDGGFRNFGMPMTVEPTYRNDVLWGFTVGIYKDGVKLTDIGVGFDCQTVNKHEWVGQGKDGFPVMEGHVDVIQGKNIEIWKLDLNPVSEALRSTIRAFCTGLVGALNRYYAFGSVFVDDERG